MTGRCRKEGNTMKKLRIWKLLLLGVLLCTLCMALSGCIVDPDKNAQPTSTFKRFDEPTPNVTETMTTATPTTDPSMNFQSWATDTPAPNSGYVGAVTPIPGTSLSGVTATPTASPTATAASSVLKRGSQGSAVQNVQEALRRLGYFEGKADGDFGEYTENAVKSFQAQNGLTADGVVGSATLAKLGSSSAKTAPPKGTPTPKPTSKPKTNVYLREGSSGADVSQMQNRLIQLGYLYGSASGKVCTITKAAIIAFQNRSGLTADGVAGPDTLEKMYANSAKKANSAVGIIGITLKKGDEGAAVRLLQSELKSYGFLKGSVDGSFGAATETAVKNFQSANGLTADGKAGSSTFLKLFAGSVSTATKTSTPKPTATRKPTATPKVTAKPTATANPTATPNMYVRVTARPDGKYFTLEQGMMGEPVKKLQQALKNAGYFKGTCDGYYGEATVTAVKNYQRAKGLVQDGKAGPATQRYLFEGDFPDQA